MRQFFGSKCSRSIDAGAICRSDCVSVPVVRNPRDDIHTLQPTQRTMRRNHCSADSVMPSPLPRPLLNSHRPLRTGTESWIVSPVCRSYGELLFFGKKPGVKVFPPGFRHRSLYAFSSELMPMVRKCKSAKFCISLRLLFEFGVEVRSVLCHGLALGRTRIKWDFSPAVHFPSAAKTG